MIAILNLMIALLSALAWASPTANVGKAGIILHGYDAVSYFHPSGPKKGSDKYQVEFNGATYQFANAENKQEFLKSSAKYEPEFGGWCAFAIADSKSKVDVDPKSFLVQDGKLLLFYNGFWGDTRDKWLHTKSKDAQVYLKEAEANWPDVKAKEP